MTPVRLPEPGERWRSPNGTECMIGPLLGNCCKLETEGWSVWMNRRMVALSWVRVEGALSECVADEAGAP